jgi:hypothetical protein
MNLPLMWEPKFNTYIKLIFFVNEFSIGHCCSQVFQLYPP